MDIQAGFFYHIKDVFFEEVQDSSLMANKGDGNYRPHYLAIQGIPLSLHDSTAKLIADNLNYNIRLHKRGIPLFFTDIDRIYHLMEEKLKTGN